MLVVVACCSAYDDNAFFHFASSSFLVACLFVCLFMFIVMACPIGLWMHHNGIASGDFDDDLKSVCIYLNNNNVCVFRILMIVIFEFVS